MMNLIKEIGKAKPVPPFKLSVLNTDDNIRQLLKAKYTFKNSDSAVNVFHSFITIEPLIQTFYTDHIRHQML